jgi:S1-C subfamily serine protease
VTNGMEKSVWTQLSSSFADTIADLENSIVAIDGGGRSTASGMVWRPGVIVTTHHVLRLRENIQILFGGGESFSARWIGSDATTDLAVLGIDSEKLAPAATSTIPSPAPEKLCCRSDVPGWEIFLRVAES